MRRCRSIGQAPVPQFPGPVGDADPAAAGRCERNVLDPVGLRGVQYERRFQQVMDQAASPDLGITVERAIEVVGRVEHSVGASQVLSLSAHEVGTGQIRPVVPSYRVILPEAEVRTEQLSLPVVEQQIVAPRISDRVDGQYSRGAVLHGAADDLDLRAIHQCQAVSRTGEMGRSNHNVITAHQVQGAGGVLDRRAVQPPQDLKRTAGQVHVRHLMLEMSPPVPEHAHVHSVAEEGQVAQGHRPAPVDRQPRRTSGPG